MKIAHHRTVNIDNVTSKEIVPEDPRRRAIVFSAHSANPYDINFNGPSAINTGIRINQTDRPTIFSWDVFGEIVTKGVQALASGAAINVGVMEVLEM